jgi:hypothetical protein
LPGDPKSVGLPRTP